MHFAFSNNVVCVYYLAFHQVIAMLTYFYNIFYLIHFNDSNIKKHNLLKHCFCHLFSISINYQHFPFYFSTCILQSAHLWVTHLSNSNLFARFGVIFRVHLWLAGGVRRECHNFSCGVERHLVAA